MVEQKDFQQMLGTFRRQALDAAAHKRMERRQQRDLQHTMDALQEVTGLSQPALQSIAEAVHQERELSADRFFSVPSQMGSVFGAISLIVGCIWLIAVWH